MQSQFVEIYETLRDTMRPAMADLRENSKRDPRAGYDADCEAIRELREFCPPSKALLKRVRRVRPEIVSGKVSQISKLLPRPEYDFFKAQMRQICVADDGKREPLPRSPRHSEGAENAPSLTEEMRWKRCDQLHAELRRVTSYGMIGMGVKTWEADRKRLFRMWKDADRACR